MTTIYGLPLQEGVAYAKAARIDAVVLSPEGKEWHGDQTAVLSKALQTVKHSIQSDIDRIGLEYSPSASLVFEAQKLMVSDPLLLDKTHAFLRQGQNAYEAYRSAAKAVIDVFEGLTSSYMRDRIVDIEDVVDQVLSAIVEEELLIEMEWTEPRILVVSKLKPSFIAKATSPNIVGVVSGEGTLQQHSARLLKTFHVPSVVVGSAVSKIKNDDYLYINATQGTVFVNPDESVLPEAFRKEGVRP